MIELENVSFSYGDRGVLTNLSATLPASGSAAVIGGSGSGKTTLFKLLAGLLVPGAGRVRGLENTRVSMVFQEDRLLSWSSALENVAFVLGGDAASARKAALGALDAMELGPRAAEPLGALSGGMRRRVAIARALAYGGDALILDEPFKGLEEALALKLMGILKGRFPLVIFSAHDREFAELFAPDAVVLLPLGEKDKQS